MEQSQNQENLRTFQTLGHNGLLWIKLFEVSAWSYRGILRAYWQLAVFPALLYTRRTFPESFNWCRALLIWSLRTIPDVIYKQIIIYFAIRWICVYLNENAKHWGIACWALTVQWCDETTMSAGPKRQDDDICRPRKVSRMPAQTDLSSRQAPCSRALGHGHIAPGPKRYWTHLVKLLEV